MNTVIEIWTGSFKALVFMAIITALYFVGKVVTWLCYTYLPSNAIELLIAVLNVAIGAVIVYGALFATGYILKK